MGTFDTQTTVNAIVAERLDRARVFEALGIDYCCGGKRPLAEICEEKGIATEEVVSRLEAHDAGASADDGVDYRAMGLAALCDDIVATHHAYLREELPRLHFLVNKIATKRGDTHPWMRGVRDAFNELKLDLEAHTAKEEQILFPMIRQLEQSSERPAFHCGSVANPIRVMEMEHDGAGRALERIHALTNGYTAPEDACNTFRVMLSSLQQLELDMHQHVHKENAILFPRAVAAEAALTR